MGTVGRWELAAFLESSPERNIDSDCGNGCCSPFSLRVFPVRDNDTNTARDYLCFLNCTSSLMCVHVCVFVCACFYLCNFLCTELLTFNLWGFNLSVNCYCLVYRILCGNVVFVNKYISLHIYTSYISDTAPHFSDWCRTYSSTKTDSQKIVS